MKAHRGAENLREGMGVGRQSAARNSQARHIPLATENHVTKKGRFPDYRPSFAALLEAEINIHYIYSFIKRPDGRSAMAINTEDLDVAAQSLSQRGFRVLTQTDITR